MRQALDLCDRIDPARSGMLGVAIDVYHVGGISVDGPDRTRASPLAGLRSFIYWADHRHFNDRGMMGDGIIDIRSITPSKRKAFMLRRGVESSNRWWSAPML
jgi:hypothetical protein